MLNPIDWFITKLAGAMIEKMLGPINQQVLSTAGVDNLGIHKSITSTSWYPVIVQGVLAAEASKQPGSAKREAVVRVLKQWCSNRNLNPPKLDDLHLAIELALLGMRRPQRRG